MCFGILKYVQSIVKKKFIVEILGFAECSRSSEVVPECKQYYWKVQYIIVYYSTYVYSEVVPECNQYNWKVKYSIVYYSTYV